MGGGLCQVLDQRLERLLGLMGEREEVGQPVGHLVERSVDPLDQRVWLAERAGHREVGRVSRDPTGPTDELPGAVGLYGRHIRVSFLRGFRRVLVALYERGTSFFFCDIEK